jgi:flagellar biosynthesis/type III secretory pathway protein FliH
MEEFIELLKALQQMTLGLKLTLTSPGAPKSSQLLRTSRPDFMSLRLPFLVLLLAACPAAPGNAQESHLTEDVSGSIYARSSFAHGYRHGYEEGYHLGNIDINMARMLRSRKSQFRGLNVGYSPEFGSRRSFEAGFQAGLKAGYSDGYDGRTFRAVESARSVAAALEDALSPADPAANYFDQGVSAGYRDGLEQGAATVLDTAPLDFHLVGCASYHPDKPKELPAQTSFCDGYQRGFVLGHFDALAPGADRPLEASK